MTRVRVAKEPPPPALPARSIFAVVAAAAFAVGVMAIAKRFSAPAAIPPPVETLQAGLAAAARRSHDRVAPIASDEADEPGAPAVAKASSRPRCICERAASPLWERGHPLAPDPHLRE